MSRNRQIGGVIPAVLFPRDAIGEPLWDRFDENLRFLLARGVSGVCVNGATGEYAAASASERREAVRRARQHTGGKQVLVAATGAAHWRQTLRHAADAEAEGADILLVPVPHFFPYSQDDIAEFYRQIAAATDLPILIYNLPQFAGGVDPDLAVRLICDEACVAGIKDSSGGLKILEALSLRPEAGAIRLIGNDAVLGRALAGGLCDGVISGVAGVLPELIAGLFEAYAVTNDDLIPVLERSLDDFIQQLDALPVPWGLKVVAECRGLAPATFSMPVTSLRRGQFEEFGQWFKTWWPEVLESTGAHHKI